MFLEDNKGFMEVSGKMWRLLSNEAREVSFLFIA